MSGLLVIMLSVLFAAGCNNILSPYTNDRDPSPAPGMGYFILQIAGSGAHERTIMPRVPNNEFAWYGLQFTGVPSGVKGDEIFRSHANLQDPIRLEAGSYTLKYWPTPALRIGTLIGRRQAEQGEPLKTR